MLPIEPILKQLSFGVNIVEYGISIDLVTGRKYNYLEILFSLLDAFNYVWSDIYSCIYRFFLWKIYFDHYISILFFNIVNTVEQSFIHVKNEEL